MKLQPAKRMSQGLERATRVSLDRLVMLMRHEESIHEVIAFPKNNVAMSPMDDCPSYVDDSQLEELHIAIKEK